ncbi:MAG: hypothetical protein LKH91_03455, partial [Prevotella sp.]
MMKMNNNKKKAPKSSKTYNFWGVFYSILLLVLLNGLLFPSLQKPKIVNTDYGTFIAELNSNRVK